MARSTPQVHSRTRTPDQTALPPNECADCSGCCEHIVAYNSVDFVDVAHRIPMDTTWSEFAFTASNPFSVAFWMVYIDAVHAPASAVSTIVARTGYDGGDAYRTGYVVEVRSSGSTRFELLSDEYGDNTDPNAYARVSETGTNVLTGGWRHIAVTYDGSGSTAGMKIYIDGALGTLSPSGSGVAGKNIITTTPANLTFLLGRSEDTAGSTINNARLRLAEFMMFNRALTADDVEHLSGRAYDAVNGCVGTINLDKSVSPWTMCPTGGLVWYRMGDDLLDALAPNPAIKDQLENARHAIPAGFTNPLFAADSPAICDCFGFGVLNVWQYDNRNDTLVYIPAMMSVESTDTTTFAASETAATLGDNRVQLLFLDRADSTPSHADHSPAEWWGSLEYDLVASTNYNAMQHLKHTGKVLIVSQSSVTLTSKLFDVSPPAHAPATNPSTFPTQAQIHGFALTPVQHPTTSQPGALLRTVGPFNTYNNLSWLYDAAAGTWSTGPTVPHHAAAGSVVAGAPTHTKVYFGRATTTQIDVYDTATSTWGTTFATPGPTFEVGSSMAVHPTTFDLYMIVDDDGTWEFWHYAVGTTTWTQLANPPLPMLAACQPMHISLLRSGADWMAFVASEKNSEWSVYKSASNTWTTYRVPAPAGQSGRARWFRTSHIATIAPRA